MPDSSRWQLSEQVAVCSRQGEGRRDSTQHPDNQDTPQKCRQNTPLSPHYVLFDNCKITSTRHSPFSCRIHTDHLIYIAQIAYFASWAAAAIQRFAILRSHYRRQVRCGAAVTHRRRISEKSLGEIGALPVLVSNISKRITPASTRRQTNVDLMLAHRLWRWPSI